MTQRHFGFLLLVAVMGSMGCPAAHAGVHAIPNIRYAATPGVVANLQSLDIHPNPPNGAPDRIKYTVHEQDVAAAIALVRSHIGEYGGDPDKIALLGHSAGAHLVALVSTDESFLNAHALPLSVIKGTASIDIQGYDIPSYMSSNPADGMYVVLQRLWQCVVGLGGGLAGEASRSRQGHPALSACIAGHPVPPEHVR